MRENKMFWERGSWGMYFVVVWVVLKWKKIILTPHNFTLRWNSFSPSNTIWIFNLTGKTRENIVRIIKHLTSQAHLRKIYHIMTQLLQGAEEPNCPSDTEVKICSNRFWYSITVNSDPIYILEAVSSSPWLRNPRSILTLV